MKGLFFLGLMMGPIAFGQEVKEDSISESLIQSIHFTKRLPVSKEILNVEKDLSQKNLGQDLPILLKNQTSVVSSSDAGNGVGYTGLRIRGVSGTSINVMMNGVPYNDSESQGTFFVNVPDLTSSASAIVIQRGVGTSTNGVSAFGASVNVISKDPAEEFYVKSDNSYGSFNTYKYSAEIGSGLFWKDQLSIMGRYTKIHSDGYIDRAFSDLDSYNLSARFHRGSTSLRLLAFGGAEQTYQAWNGIDKESWKTRPKFNSSGAIYNEDWSEIVGFYDNETDNYRQNHYQFLWDEKFNDSWSLQTTLHYTKGKGYYENYKQGKSYETYGLSPVNGNAYSDFIRKKWLDNDFYGVASNLYGDLSGVDLHFGLVANQYFGRHFGEAKDYLVENSVFNEYYRNRSVKNEISGFGKAIAKVGRWEIFGDLQMRSIVYDTKILQPGDEEGADLRKNWNFFNPKVGLNYPIPSGKLYLSYAKASREPSRDDLFANPEVKEETLHDFELGWEYSLGSSLLVSANLYYMHYVNQLVLSGQINSIGEFIRTNSGKSYRTGLELTALAKLSRKWEINSNLTLSRNRNIDFKLEDENEVVNLGNTPISFSPEFLANLSVRFQPNENLSFGLQNQFVGRQYLDNTQRESLQTASYFLSDLSARYRLELTRNEIEFKLLVNNIFNQKYVNNGYVYDSEPYYFSQAGTNFLFGLSYTFH